jgi:hypothetical protein
MRKAFSFPELTIVFIVLLLSITVLTSLSFSYLSILNSIKTRYIALNLAQEGIELAIALRNKQIETGAQPWAGVSTAGTYCLEFENGQIIASRFSKPCETKIPGYQRLITYSGSDSALKVTSEVYFGRDKIKLETVLTKWHPT